MGQQVTVAGAEQTVVADFDEAWWKDVLQEAANELFGSDGAKLRLRSRRVFISKSNVAILQCANAVIAEGPRERGKGEILERGGASADRLAVDHPILFPDALVHRAQTEHPFSIRRAAWRGRAALHRKS